MLGSYGSSSPASKRQSLTVHHRTSLTSPADLYKRPSGSSVAHPPLPDGAIVATCAASTSGTGCSTGSAAVGPAAVRAAGGASRRPNAARAASTTARRFFVL